MAQSTGVQVTDKRRMHWRANRRVTAVLLAVWFVVTFVLAYFARDLSFEFFGWPFSVWVAGQGALIVYAAIIWIYQTTMARIDRECDLHEDP